MTERTFTVTVDSPYGTQAIEQFYHHLIKIADEAETRWGIKIEVSKATERDKDLGVEDG
jgi:hypothetical protein